MAQNEKCEVVSQIVETTSMPDNEVQIINLLNYWLPRTTKAYESAVTPKNRAELLEFINKNFASFKRDEQECWKQLNNIHLMTPQMLNLYQKKFIQVQSMNWIQLLCYKVIVCPNGKECRSYREQKMLHNQFYDFELECPYFHDVKDRRRIVLPSKPDEEFKYKGKYQEVTGEENLEDSFSHNYFESVFHPLFYKFFECKRLQCRGSIFCPMKHSEEERVAWEEEFSLCWKKDRSIYYPKKKKNSSDFSEESIEDKSPYRQVRITGQNYNMNNGLNNARFNSQQQFNGNRKHQNTTPNQNFKQFANINSYHYDKQQQQHPNHQQQRYNRNFYDQSQQQYQVQQHQQYPQEQEPSDESKFLKMFFPQQQANKTKQVVYEVPQYNNSDASQYSGYNGQHFGQFINNNSINHTEARTLPSNTAYYGDSFQHYANNQEDDGYGLNFEGIFSTNNQYSQPHSVMSDDFTSINSYNKKQSGYNTQKVFYPEKMKYDQNSHIQVN